MEAFVFKIMLYYPSHIFCNTWDLSKNGEYHLDISQIYPGHIQLFADEFLLNIE